VLRVEHHPPLGRVAAAALEWGAHAWWWQQEQQQRLKKRIRCRVRVGGVRCYAGDDKRAKERRGKNEAETRASKKDIHRERDRDKNIWLAS
jgi:hypothetical protein